MSMHTPNNPQFRPPAEADNLILQVDEGCPYNACDFCGMYHGMRYRSGEVQPLIIDNWGLGAGEMWRLNGMMVAGRKV